MATYVIVHGATAGGWYMRPVARLLEARGHEVYAPTLTGMGERTHLASPQIGLDTHIQDVVNVLEYEDLREVILVGKSYSGLVVTGVAERVPERIARLIYVNAMVPRDGESLADLLGQGFMSAVEAATKANDGWRIPTGEGADWRFSPMWLRMLRDSVSLRSPEAARKPRAYIYGTAHQEGPVREAAEKVVSRVREAGWRYYELPTGHEPEHEVPHELADLLHQIAMTPE